MDDYTEEVWMKVYSLSSYPGDVKLFYQVGVRWLKIVFSPSAVYFAAKDITTSSVVENSKAYASFPLKDRWGHFLVQNSPSGGTMRVFYNYRLLLTISGTFFVNQNAHV